MITLTITPVDNVDMMNMCVIDNTKVKKVDYEECDTIHVWRKDQISKDIVNRISLFDDLLIIDDIKYKVLHFYSEG